MGVARSRCARAAALLAKLELKLPRRKMSKYGRMIKSMEPGMQFRCRRSTNKGQHQWSRSVQLSYIKIGKTTIEIEVASDERTTEGISRKYTVLKSWVKSISKSDAVVSIKADGIEIEFTQDATKHNGEIDALYDSIRTDKQYNASYTERRKRTSRYGDDIRTEIPARNDGVISENAIEKIYSLIGQSCVKKAVSDLVNILTVNRMRAEIGIDDHAMSHHMVFYGNPGTGKTTIARLLGSIYRELGVLSKGHFIEADRSMLVAGYVGQTAIKATSVLESALGGILFIDEAYTLTNADRPDQFGEEAINTILKYMEDHREDLVVIVAGYQEEMEQFIDTNPGLKSRFNKYLNFEDYTAKELSQIFHMMVADASFVLTQDASVRVDEIFLWIHSKRSKGFGNGRTARNFLEKTLVNQANRIVRLMLSSKDELLTIESEDLREEDAAAVVN